MHANRKNTGLCIPIIIKTKIMSTTFDNMTVLKVTPPPWLDSR